MMKRNGFTLLEILISTVIMAVAISGTLQVLNYQLQMNETNKVTVLCINRLQGLIDEISNTPYDDIINLYDGQQVQLPELTNLGIQHSVLYTAAEIEPSFIIRVKIVVCWKNRMRVIGEDLNLDAALDAGEDLNENGELDSPLMMEALVIDK